MQCMQLLRSGDVLHAAVHGGHRLHQMWRRCAIKAVDSPVVACPLHRALWQLDLAAVARHSAASPPLAGAD